MTVNKSPEKPSAVPVPEQALGNLEAKESGIETESQPKPIEQKQATTEEAASVQAPPVVLPDKPVQPAKDAYHQRVERVLEDGLSDKYLKLPKEKRQEFKVEGERVAVQLRQMIDSTKIKVKEVMNLIINWLKTIPGVSRWFLEQEAKIKADKVILLAEERRKEKEGL